MGKFTLVFLVGLWQVSIGFSQLNQPRPVLARSRSGQFIVQSLSTSIPGVATVETNRSFIRLDPTLVTVSCERIKQILARRLGTTLEWKGKIFLVLYRASSAEDEIDLVTDRFRDGWQYRLGLPDVLERRRYVRAIAQVLLLELANRNATTQSAEIPAWLVEGFTQELLTSSENQIIIEPPIAMANGIRFASMEISGVRTNGLNQAHKTLSGRAPLSFQELSWPMDDQFDGEAGAIFRSSAHLFLARLLDLKEGASALRTMLALLPAHYNWQFAFLQAFHTQFDRPRDVEKWWALQAAHFSGHETDQTWIAEESWQRLDEVLKSAVEVRTDRDALPLRAEVPMQTIVREWDPTQQAEALQAKLQELGQLRMRVGREFIPIIDAYRQVLATYLAQLQTHSSQSNQKAGSSPVTKQTLQELERLDRLRSGLRPATKADRAGELVPPAELSDQVAR